jgi:hypothetical protein
MVDEETGDNWGNSEARLLLLFVSISVKEID